ncbi:MAG TPA: hypothetical protein VGC54_10490, partial [Planctomycetota bacterium]
MDGTSPAWLWCLQAGDVAGIVACTDQMSAADLNFLEAAYHAGTETFAILVVGGRGIAGYESLLASPHVHVLPEPWTPAALEHVLRDRLGVGLAKTNGAPLAPAGSSAPAEAPAPPDPAASAARSDADEAREAREAYQERILEELASSLTDVRAELRHLRERYDQLREHSAAETRRQAELV